MAQWKKCVHHGGVWVLTAVPLASCPGSPVPVAAVTTPSGWRRWETAELGVWCGHVHTPLSMAEMRGRWIGRMMWPCSHTPLFKSNLFVIFNASRYITSVTNFRSQVHKTCKWLHIWYTPHLNMCLHRHYILNVSYVFLLPVLLLNEMSHRLHRYSNRCK